MTQPSAPRSVGTRPRVLVFFRFYLAADFLANVNPLKGEFEFSFLTDGASAGVADTRHDFYAAMRAGTRSQLLTPQEVEDIRARCRLLRNIDPTRASAMMHAMAIALERTFERVRPAAVLCHMVDDYVTHLVAVLAAKRQAKYVGYAYSYFPGLIQLTEHAYGSAFNVRLPSDEEVDSVLQTITQRTYRQNYLQRSNYTWRQHVLGVARYRVKQIVFGTRRWLERDPENLHYAVTPYIVERRRLSDFPMRRDFDADWRSALAPRRSTARAGIVTYLPLGYFPESTIDYWVPDRRIIDYENTMIEVARALGQHGHVLVKEHLHMMGARRPAFYRDLKRIPGVICVHPTEYSNDVLDAADAVVLGGGSIGVEATLRGKPVFSYCPTCYWFSASKAVPLDLSQIERWHTTISMGVKSHTPLSREAQFEFVRQCLRSTVRPRPGAKRWPLIQEDDLRTLLHAAVASVSSHDRRLREHEPALHTAQLRLPTT